MEIHHNLRTTQIDIPPLGLSRTLTRRENQCLQLSFQRKSIKEIAHCMRITIHNVKLHKRNICIKLKCSNMSQAIATSVKGYFDYFMLIPGNIFWKAREGKYLGCNDIFARGLGLSSAEEVIGKTDYDLPVSKEDSDAYRRDDKEVMDSRVPKLNLEEEQTFSDGRKIYLLTSKVPVFTEKNEVMGVIGVYSDITDLKKAKEKTEVANDAKTEFILNIAHDLRTPDIKGTLSIQTGERLSKLLDSIVKNIDL